MKNNNLIRWLVNILFIGAFGFVTFFGIGPVLIADGSFRERMLTLVVVILIYIVLIFGVVYWTDIGRENKTSYYVLMSASHLGAGGTTVRSIS